MDLAAGCTALLAALGARPLRLGLGYRTRTRAGADVGWHHHELAELVYHHRGLGQVQSDGEAALPYAAGDVELHAPRSRHRQPGERDGEDWCLHLVLPCRWPATLPALVHMPAGDWAFASADLATLTEHPGAELPAAAALAHDLRAGALLVEALAAIGQPPRRQQVFGDHARRCRELIDRRFASLGLVDELAAELGLSPDRLRHLFRASFGCGPRAYLRQVRLHAAQRLLADTPLALDEVAIRCGIGNARQLCDLFRDLAGLTPGGWRRQARQPAPAAG